MIIEEDKLRSSVGYVPVPALEELLNDPKLSVFSGIYSNVPERKILLITEYRLLNMTSRRNNRSDRLILYVDHELRSNDPIAYQIS